MPDQIIKRKAAKGFADKACAACGRTVEWRKSWAKNWESVKFCSDRCRSSKPGEKDWALEKAIMRLLEERGAGKTICPSEAARDICSNDDTFESLLEPARAAARRLVDQGKIVITQKGLIVDGSTAKGPIRLRLR